MHTKFGEEDRIWNALFSLVPTNILKVKAELRDLADKLKFLEADLPMPSSLLAELKEWVAHWERRPGDKHPVNLLECFQQADPD